MKISTTNPMTDNHVSDLDNAPFVAEGTGESALKICFESERSKRAYMEFATESAHRNSAEFYNQTADNETMGTIN